ncbi:MAG: CRISPR-associated helicase Cas3' [Rickettsiales bacterium]|nr:CRISPR-associated helicase Cas3' [Rickettsiales bacterium]
MMVTFVSQCEKKALNRTRRVLDAFANRIGTNTWQTVITEEGLIAVKNLLKKTATKNTAVSCHWIRSRSRSELVWIVGNRDQFNSEGMVAVNTTEKELFMDIKNNKPKENMIYANTHLQPLAEHLFAVGYLAEILHKKLIPHLQEYNYEPTFVAGCLHDLGKIDPHFQEWVRNPKKKDYVAEDGQHIDDSKFNFDKHPRHNEISVLLYQLFDHSDLSFTSPGNKESIKHAIYWHHSKPFRKEKDFTNYGDIYSKLTSNLKDHSFSLLLEKSIQMLNKVCELNKKYRGDSAFVISKIFNTETNLNSIEESFRSWSIIPLPQYKDYKPEEDIKKYREKWIGINSYNNLMRSCLIAADRKISSLPAEELEDHIKNNKLETLLDDLLLLESNLKSEIGTCLKNFSKNDRTNKQQEIAKQLSEVSGVAVLSGPAGCGKTKIALEWAKLRNAQKIIWICPRVQICQGLFKDLTEDERYLPNTQIEIYTGEFKFTKTEGNLTPEDEYFKGDIVITTIDQIFNSIISHTKADTLIDYLNAHVVFDEFHEYINMPAFNLLFAELIEAKKQQESSANCLLVSATPHYFYLEEILKIRKDKIIEMPSFNERLYKIQFKTFDETKHDETNPLYQKQSSSTFVISNTALTAQKSFIRNQQENSILLHSKFKKNDKKKLFNEVFESFKKDGTKQFDILRSGPIVQASLNISCDYMISEMDTAENILQRLGRLDRFGKNLNATNTLTIAITENVKDGKCVGSSAKFLNSMKSLQSTKAWYQFLNSSLDDKPTTLPKLYEFYKKFYELEDAKKLIGSDLLKSLQESVHLINRKVMDPIKVFSSKKEGRSKIRKNSLRGDNYFVQMAVCDVSDFNNPKFLDRYAYEMPVNERDEIDNLTASRDEIEGYGDSNKNLLSHMMKKHHNIKDKKKAYKDFILLNEARDPEFPIDLSYTPNDLVQVGGESARHEYAIYYAVCDKQPIGAISIKQLKSNEE